MIGFRCEMIWLRREVIGLRREMIGLRHDMIGFRCKMIGLRRETWNDWIERLNLRSKQSIKSTPLNNTVMKFRTNGYSQLINKQTNKSNQNEITRLSLTSKQSRFLCVKAPQFSQAPFLYLVLIVPWKWWWCSESANRNDYQMVLRKVHTSSFISFQHVLKKEGGQY